MTKENLNYSWSWRQYISNSLLIELWKWEWMAHLTFSEDNFFTPPLIKKILLHWIRELCKKERIQVGFFYVLAYLNEHPHLHLLMLGRGKTINVIKIYGM